MEGDGSGGLIMPLILILMLVAMYFLVMRPNNKRRREMQEKQRQASAGQTIVTIGGLHATIIDSDDTTVTLEVSPGVMCVYERGAIARVLEDEDVSDTTVPDNAAELTEGSTDSTDASDSTDEDESKGEVDASDKSEKSDKKKDEKSVDSKPRLDGTQN